MTYQFSIIAALLLPLAVLHAAPPLNILFFTADDMNYDSTGVCGGPIKDLTPHIDRLAAEGLRFEHAYSTVAVCQPVRQTMQTGLYPHRSGSMGFFPIKPEEIPEVPGFLENLPNIRKELAGYYTAAHQDMLNKE